VLIGEKTEPPSSLSYLNNTVIHQRKNSVTSRCISKNETRNKKHSALLNICKRGWTPTKASRSISVYITMNRQEKYYLSKCRETIYRNKAPHHLHSKLNGIKII
jgi:hypothetical protein